MTIFHDKRMTVRLDIPAVLGSSGVIIEDKNIPYDYVESAADLCNISFCRVEGVKVSEDGIRIYFENNGGEPICIHINCHIYISGGAGTFSQSPENLVN